MDEKQDVMSAERDVTPVFQVTGLLCHFFILTLSYFVLFVFRD